MKKPRLPLERVHQVMLWLNAGKSGGWIAKRAGCAESTVWRIKKRISWAHVPWPEVES